MAADSFFAHVKHFNATAFYTMYLQNKERCNLPTATKHCTEWSGEKRCKMQQSIINLIVCYCGYDIRVTDTIDFMRSCLSMCMCMCLYLQILLAFLIDSIKYIDNKRQQQPLRGKRAREWFEANFSRLCVCYSLGFQRRQIIFAPFNRPQNVYLVSIVYTDPHSDSCFSALNVQCAHACALL